MASNRNILVDRLRNAARELSDQIEETRAAFAEYERLGGAAYTDPFFHDNENVNDPLRTDLNITKAQLTAAAVGLNAIAGHLQAAPGAGVNDYLPALSRVK